MDLQSDKPGLTPNRSVIARGVTFGRTRLALPGLRMTTYNGAPGENVDQFPARPNQHTPPLPVLSPYVSQEKRFSASHSENCRSRDPRPAILPKLGETSSVSRPLAALSSIPRPRSPVHFRRPPSPPPSRGQQPPLPIASTFQRADWAYYLSQDMSRSRSYSSEQSAFSAPSISRTPSMGSDEPRGESSRRTHATSEPGLGALAAQRPKRSRVLMTHAQQGRLSALWKQVGENRMVATTAG